MVVTEVQRVRYGYPVYDLDYAASVPVSTRGGRAALYRRQNRREGLRNSEWASVQWARANI